MKQHMEILIIPFGHVSAGIDVDEIIGVYSAAGEKAREWIKRQKFH